MRTSVAWTRGHVSVAWTRAHVSVAWTRAHVSVAWMRAHVSVARARLAATGLGAVVLTGCAIGESIRTDVEGALAALPAPVEESAPAPPAPAQPMPVESEGPPTAPEFADLEAYVLHAADVDALEPADCRRLAAAAANGLDTVARSDVALRLTLTTGCPAATARTLRTGLRGIDALLDAGEEAAGAPALPGGHAAFLRLRREAMRYRLGVTTRVARLRSALGERDAELSGLRAVVERSSEEVLEERAARRLLQRDLVRAQASVLAAREKLRAVSRIEAEVQQAGEAAEVQTEWSESATEAAPADNGEPTVSTE